MCNYAHSELLSDFVKLARAKLLAMAPGKVFCRLIYLKMQSKISAGNHCLRFRRVTGGSLPAPASDLRKDFNVRVRADFFKPRDVSFHPVRNNCTKVTTCCL